MYMCIYVYVYIYIYILRYCIIIIIISSSIISSIYIYICILSKLESKGHLASPPDHPLSCHPLALHWVKGSISSSSSSSSSSSCPGVAETPRPPLLPARVCLLRSMSQ